MPCNIFHESWVWTPTRSYMLNGEEVNSIISEQTILLCDQYEVVKGRVDRQGLREIYKFNDDQKSLTFKTEKIHPEITGNKFTCVMFLFSNPHPLSVKSGLFLSEPRSRSFWQRLFECKHLKPTEKIKSAIASWNDEAPGILSDCLLKCEYGGKFRLFFDCLEALPTYQYADLKKLFVGKKGREIRKRVLQDPGVKNLVEVSQKNNIESWIVFSAEAYRCLNGEKNIAKNAPKRICEAIDTYHKDPYTNKFWESLKDLKRTIQCGNQLIKVYLALIARSKNWKAKNGERYFTVMLNQIFDDILESSR